MQVVSNPRLQPKWKQAYQEAVFELDPTRLQPKLEAARRAVEDRLLQVGSRGSADHGELIELQDAQRTIRLLVRHELQA